VLVCILHISTTPPHLITFSSKPNSSVWEKFSRASSNVTDLWSEDNNSSSNQSTVQAFPKWKTTFILNYLANPQSKKATPLNDVEFIPHSPSIQSPLSSLGSNLGDVAQAIKTNAPALASKLASKISPVMGQLKVPFKKTYR
jgi:hypothetical protein